MANNKRNKSAEQGGVTLQRKPWKVWMSVDPTPSAVLTTLYDLIFDEKSEDSWSSIAVKAKAPEGLALGHNILLYDQNLYNASHGGIETGATGGMDTFWKRKIDLCYAASYPDSPKREIDVKGKKYYVPEKTSVKYPLTSEDVYQGGTLRSGAIPSSLIQVVEFPVAPYATTSASNASICIAASDLVFDASLTTEPTLKSYTQLFLNIDNTTATSTFIETPLMFINYCIKQVSASSTDTDHFLSMSDFTNWVKNGTDNAKDVLKHCFVWVQAPFAADYIDPKDFNQDLNQESEVTHKNIYSAKEGHNFSRYDEFSKDDWKNSIGYLPSNAPLKDLLSNKLEDSWINKKDNNNNIINTFLKNYNSDTSSVGQLLTMPIIESKPQISPSFLDPGTYSALQQQNPYENYKGDLPSLLSKEGNLYTDGRILSPTIDELWYSLKKLIVGRPSDIEGNDTIDFGSVKGEGIYENLTDTQIENVKAFPLPGNKSGDPISLSFDDKNGIQVTEYVTNVNTIGYVDFEEITSYRTTLYNAHETKIPDYVKLNKDVSKYEPRANPLSLRELEARTLVNKYNTLNAYNDIITNFTLTGQHGYVDEDGDDDKKITLAAGSLYMLHKDYSPKYPKKTVFRMNGKGEENDENWGIDVTFGDLAGNSSEDKLYLYNNDLAEEFTIKTSKKPLLVKNYGKSTSLYEEDGQYTGADVYMAADGTWRYKQEHVRLPILRSQF